MDLGFAIPEFPEGSRTENLGPKFETFVRKNTDDPDNLEVQQKSQIKQENNIHFVAFFGSVSRGAELPLFTFDLTALNSAKTTRYYQNTAYRQLFCFLTCYKRRTIVFISVHYKEGYAGCFSFVRKTSRWYNLTRGTNHVWYNYDLFMKLKERQIFKFWKIANFYCRSGYSF